MKPATSLPWQINSMGYAIGNSGTKTVVFTDCEDGDLRYIVHACNAYPKLVALVKDWSEEYGHGSFLALLKELGE